MVTEPQGLSGPASSNKYTKIFTKTVKIGLHKDAEEYIAAVNAADMKIGDWGIHILNQIPYSQQRESIELFVSSVQGLGFEEGAKYSDICTRVAELGFKPCPAEVGVVVRLTYTRQPQNEWMLIVMDPILGWDESRHFLYVANDDGKLVLDGDFSDPGIFWDAGCLVVFSV